MKKKGNRSIPDFSRKPQSAHPPVPGQKLDASAPAPTSPRAPIVKPHSTSMKSGRRGQ